MGVVEFTETKISLPLLFGQQSWSDRVNPKKTHQCVSACPAEDRWGPHKFSTAFSLSDPQLSLMVKVIPSPDWFVGVDSINLCQGDQWKEEVTFDLQPFDAGTDSGFTFSSPNFPTSPVERVTKVGFPGNKTYVLVVHELIVPVTVDGLHPILTASSRLQSVSLSCLHFK